MAKRVSLDPGEKEIEDRTTQFVPISGEKLRRIDAILEKTRKTRNIRIVTTNGKPPALPGRLAGFDSSGNS